MSDAVSTAEPKPTSPTTTAATASHKQSPNTKKFYSHFVFRALLAAIFLVIIPMLPSLIPANSSSTTTQSLSTQSWELLHMILVGIAVSYGLFSRRYDDSGGGDEPNNNPKAENAHESTSYVSRLLQVTSVFDDEVTDHHHPSSSSPGGAGSFDHVDTGGSNKVQAWSSRYYRNQPPSMVIQPTLSTTDVGEEERRQQQQQQHLLKSSSNTGILRDDGKPLLLPIRSLKSRISDEHGGEAGEIGSRSPMYRRTKSSSSAGLSSIRNEESTDGGSTWMKNGNRISRSRVLPDVAAAAGNYLNGDGYGVSQTTFSRSNSSNLTSSGSNSTDGSTSNGRRRRRRNSSVVGEEGLDEGNQKNKVAEETSSVVLPSPIPWKSRSGKREMTPAPEVDNTNININTTHSQSSARSSSTSSPIKLSSPSSSGSSTPTGNGSSPINPHPKLESRTRDNPIRRRRRKSLDQSSPPPRSPKPSSLEELNPVHVISASGGDHQISSARNRKRGSTRRKSRGLILLDEQEDEEDDRLGYQVEEGNDLRTRPDSPIAKSVRTIRGGGESSSSSSAATEMRMSGRSDDDRIVHRNNTNVTETSPASLSLDHSAAGETNDFLEQVMIASDDDSEEESENDVGTEARDQFPKEENVSIVHPSSTADVDKKADEFIAKFREQIRLQRIESIKRSSGQLSRK